MSPVAQELINYAYNKNDYLNVRRAVIERCWRCDGLETGTTEQDSNVFVNRGMSPYHAIQLRGDVSLCSRHIMQIENVFN